MQCYHIKMKFLSVQLIKDALWWLIFIVVFTGFSISLGGWWGIHVGVTCGNVQITLSGCRKPIIPWVENRYGIKEERVENQPSFSLLFDTSKYEMLCSTWLSMPQYTDPSETKSSNKISSLKLFLSDI